MIVTVTSCRSDAYHSQKAPGATTKVPRKAPSASSSSASHNNNNNSSDNTAFSSAEDGFSTVTAPVTTKNLAKLQQALNDSPATSSNNNNAIHNHHNAILTGSDSSNSNNNSIIGGANNNNNNNNGVQPKDELVDVIRGLQTEKLLKQNNDPTNQTSGGAMSGVMTSPSDLKPNWLPKADIPSAVPNLSVEYIHRHRLMKQVVNCLLDKSSSSNMTSSSTPRDMDEFIGVASTAAAGMEHPQQQQHSQQQDNYHLITSITSRHADKAGNGKTTLAVLFQALI